MDPKAQSRSPNLGTILSEEDPLLNSKSTRWTFWGLSAALHPGVHSRWDCNLKLNFLAGYETQNFGGLVFRCIEADFASKLLIVNINLKALAEMYTIHIFAQISDPKNVSITICHFSL